MIIGENNMKAVVVHKNGVIKYEELDLPLMTKNTVKVKIKACGVCRSDIPRILNNSAHFYPIVLGHEFSGIIVDKGEEVKNVDIGDHVAGIPLMPCYECENCKNGDFALCKNYKFIGSSVQGAFADYIVLPQNNVFKIDVNIPFEQGTLFEPSTVALHAIFKSNFSKGKRVAILGGGTIGLFVLQWAKALGASEAVVVGRDKSHLQIASKLGVDKVISTLDYNNIFDDETLIEVGKYDFIYEASGAEEMIRWSFLIANAKATICMIGTPTNGIMFPGKQWEIINRKELNVVGSWMSYSSPFPGMEWKMTNEFFMNKKLKYIPEMFYKAFSMKDADKAFNLFNSGEKIKGRVLLKNDM